MKTTTLNQILSFGPCGEAQDSNYGWQKLLAGLGKSGPDDEPLALLKIFEINGIADAVWAARTQPRNSIIDLACRFAESVAHLTTDPRAAEAVRVARGVIAGTHTREQARAYAFAASASDAAAYAFAAAYGSKLRTEIFTAWAGQ